MKKFNCNIRPVQIVGGWDVKISADGYPDKWLCGGTAPYTMHQARLAVDNLRRDTARHGIGHIFGVASK